MENNYCYICMDYKNDNNMKKLNCNHIFCHDCIKEWFKKKNICPMCRNIHEEKIEEIMIPSIGLSLKEFSIKYGFNIRPDENF